MRTTARVPACRHTYPRRGKVPAPARSLRPSSRRAPEPPRASARRGAGRGGKGKRGGKRGPRWSAAAATARPGGSRAPRAPGGEGREPSAMATAQARGEAEQPPLLRVATTLGEGDGGDRRGAGPKPELHWAETGTTSQWASSCGACREL
ncbi:unnamed protein product [Rangifer tarandus platyrhynchus]|uniref:Uncharacterized protein n=2 Tax=Rangifer tarandus platyrhynchus TaxID=3082113 RepID=A0ABN8ZSN2_RANTA|nr:unnamed protein product [Rangifer tarandus platyrhynchus]CAI9709745.1 unnamed protein product [Rangifer tarandus platyrhynchus]